MESNLVGEIEMSRGRGGKEPKGAFGKLAFYKMPPINRTAAIVTDAKAQGKSAPPHWKTYSPTFPKEALDVSPPRKISWPSWKEWSERRELRRKRRQERKRQNPGA